MIDSVTTTFQTKRSNSFSNKPGQNINAKTTLTYLNPVINVRSHFSDDEDEEDHSKTSEENFEGILEIAERADKVKESRHDLMLKITTALPVKEEPSDINESYNTEPCGVETKEASSAGNQSEKTKSDSKSPGTMENKECGSNLSSDELDEVDEKIDREMQKPRVAVINQNEGVNITTETNAGIHKVPESKVKNSFGLTNPYANKNTLPVLEGILTKKSTNMLKLWQKRYYVLKDKKLYYYKDEHKQTKSGGVIDFDLISVKLEKGKDDREIKIIPLGGSRIFFLKAGDETEGRKWYEALEKHIQASEGSHCQLQKVVKSKRYWKYDRISEEDFVKQADTGDILLFKTKHIGAKIQRSITMSDYDHVALLLKFNTGEIVLFEATGKQGVGLCRWSTFMKSKWHLLYHRLVFRKLQIARSEEVIGGIEKFVRASVGKKYGVSAKKLLKKKSTTDDEHKTFFCSELVAACYKKVGLLPKEISAANYLPGAFAAEKKMELLDNAKLGEEYLIDFGI